MIISLYSLFIDAENFKDILMKQQVDIFLFVNPRSGSRHGQKFLDLGFAKVSFELGSAEWAE